MNEKRWGVIFDFGGVLSSGWGSRAALSQAAAELGIAPEDLANRLFSGPAWEQASRGEIPPPTYWAQVTAGLPVESTHEVLAPLGENPFFGEVLNPDAVALVHMVRAAGHRVALCSNALPSLLSVLAETLPLYLAFDVVVISALTGARKPERTIYERTLARLRMPAHQCVFIDDRERNLVAASELGIHTVHFTDLGEVMAALRTLGVLSTEVVPDEE